MVDRNRPPPDKITVEKYSLKNDIGTVEKKSELIHPAQKFIDDVT